MKSQKENTLTPESQEHQYRDQPSNFIESPHMGVGGGPWKSCPTPSSYRTRNWGPRRTDDLFKQLLFVSRRAGWDGAQGPWLQFSFHHTGSPQEICARTTLRPVSKSHFINLQNRKASSSKANCKHSCGEVIPKNHLGCWFSDYNSARILCRK